MALTQNNRFERNSKLIQTPAKHRTLRKESLMKTSRIRALFCFVATACLIVASMFITPGCAADEIAVAKAAIPQVQQEVKKTQAALEQTQQEIAVAKAAGQDTAAAEKVVTSMQSALAKADVALTQLHNILRNSTSTADLIEHGSREGSSLVPGGYGPLVALAGTTIAALVRAHQNRVAARDIAYAIEQAKEQGKVDFDSPAVVAKISANMGARAKRIVDEAQGDVTPFPV